MVQPDLAVSVGPSTCLPAMMSSSLKVRMSKSSEPTTSSESPSPSTSQNTMEATLSPVTVQNCSVPRASYPWMEQFPAAQQPTQLLLKQLAARRRQHRMVLCSIYMSRSQPHGSLNA